MLDRHFGIDLQRLGCNLFGISVGNRFYGESGSGFVCGNGENAVDRNARACRAAYDAPCDRVVKRAGARNGCFEGVRAVSDDDGFAASEIHLNARYGDGNGGVLRNENDAALSCSTDEDRRRQSGCISVNRKRGPILAIHLVVNVRTDGGKLYFYRIFVICDEIAILGILSAGGVQSVIREIEHAPERNRVFGRVKRRKDKVVCRQLVGDGGGSHGCLTHSDVLACGDNRAFFCQGTAHRAVFVAGVSVRVKSGCGGIFQLTLGVVRGFVAVDCASRIFAWIPVRILIMFPRGSVKIVLGDDKPDGCGCFHARSAVLGIFRCSAELYRGDVCAHCQTVVWFYAPTRSIFRASSDGTGVRIKT